MLRVPPIIKDAYLVNALKCAGRRAPFLRIVFPIEVLHRVILESNARVAALLRTPMDQTVFTDVEITSSGAATPVVRLALGDAVLKPVETRVIAVPQFLDRLEDTLFFVRERLERAVVVVYDADRGREPQFDGAARNDERVFGRLDPTADHGIDVDMKIRV